VSSLGKALRLVARVTLATVIALVVVPTVINVQTGGTAPRMLKPYTSWLWPALGVLVAAVVVLEVWEPVRRLFAPINAKHPDDPRNLPNALRQIQQYVQQRFRGSLAERVRVQLALEERPEAVLPPASLVQRVSGEETSVPPGTEIIEVFDAMQHPMLILGAPGAGKTTLLLDLASSLATRAAESPNEQAGRIVPVLVDLADWSSARRRRRSIFNLQARWARDFTTWLLATVDRRYKIPSSVGRVWLGEGRLALLLDGLDEVHPDSRDRCVQEINALQERYPIPQLAVCCREADYEVMIRPLTRDQVLDYFARSELHGMAGVSAALADDPQLWELFTSPLILNIMALAYGDRPAGALSIGGDVTERRRQLFDAYLVEVLARRGAPHARYPPEETIRALKVLATASIQMDAGIAVRKPTVDTWIKAASDRTAWVCGARLVPAANLGFLSVCLFVLAQRFGVVTALVVGAVVFLLQMVYMDTTVAFARPRDIRRTRGAIAAVAGLAYGGALGASTVVTATAVASLVNNLPSWLAATLVLVLLAAGASSIMVIVGQRSWALAVGAVVLVRAAVPIWLLGLSVLLGYAVGLVVTTLAMASTTLFAFEGEAGPQPTEARLVRRRRWLGLISLAALVVAVAAGAPILGPIVGVTVGLVVAVPLGGLVGAVAAMVFRSLWMPLVHAIAGDTTPWRRRFWRFAADRSILTRTDGEFRFIHILVRDHLAACDPDALARSLRHRSAQVLGAAAAA
jgi:hypothetical protein